MGSFFFVFSLISLSTNVIEDAVQDELSQGLYKMRWKMRKTKLYMDTVVDIQVVTKEPKNQAEDRIDRAFNAFYKVEQACSRFNQESELMKACLQIETWVPLSPYVFEPLRFALEMAESTKWFVRSYCGEDNGNDWIQSTLFNRAIDPKSIGKFSYLP